MRAHISEKIFSGFLMLNLEEIAIWLFCAEYTAPYKNHKTPKIKGPYTNHVATKGERGVPQKTTTLHNSYLIKVATLGGGGQNSEKNGYVVCVWPLRSHIWTHIWNITIITGITS